MKNGKPLNLTYLTELINPEKSVYITKKRVLGLKIRIEGYFYSDGYVMKSEDKLFVKIKDKKRYVERIKVSDPIEIWGYPIKDFNYSGFKVDLPIWHIQFQFGLETKEVQISLKTINVITKFLQMLKIS
ncbi:hypothetical protein [Scopulibacillus darangshiensis]|uniref:hypothetical protein n=1 Tax=Scopulibacillus darangshiensis TaxID=442528 RepID=UPI00104A0BBE|nr:hypothetical protein [Scopulibacillus darangshiensis]